MGAARSFSGADTELWRQGWLRTSKLSVMLRSEEVVACGIQVDLSLYFGICEILSIALSLVI